MSAVILVLLFGLLFAVFTFAQLLPWADPARRATDRYQLFPNLTYFTAGGHELKLDIYKRRDTTGPQPTVMYMHGGFWATGTKEASLASLTPWFEMGWNIVNVEYRLSGVAAAPAAVEDCRRALRFVHRHAAEYSVDVTRIVLTGESAGGHLALATGIIPNSAGFDGDCPGAALPRVAAIINWYGITDVCDVITGPHRASAAMKWFASLPDAEALARRVSPLAYVRPGLPPILTIHGNADGTVPYEHSLRLHEALNNAGVSNHLLTIPGGEHGNFTPLQRRRIFMTMHEFLMRNLPTET